MTLRSPDNLRACANGAVPAPGGATYASFTLFTALASLLAALYAGSEWLTASGTFGFPTDAAWVRATFARSLAVGHGLSFTAGPVAGAPAPSWLLALILGAAVSDSFVLTAKVLGVASVGVAAMLTWGIALRLLEDWRFAFLAGLLVVVSPRLSAEALGGMEGPLAAMLVMAASYWQGVSWEGSRHERVMLAMAVGLAALARPELVLLLPLVFLDRVLITAVRSRFEQCYPLALVRAGGEAAGAVLIVLPYVVYNRYIGGPLWQRMEVALRPPSPLTWVTGVLGALWANNPLLLVLAAAGLVVVVLAAARENAKYPTFLPALLPITLLMAPGFLWHGAAPANARQAATCLTPMVCVLGAAGLFLLYRAARPLAQRVRNRASRIAFGGGIAVVVATLLAFMVPEQVQGWEQHGRLVKRVNSLQVAAGKWASQHLPADASIASREVGGIGFFGHRRVVDLGGTISTEGISFLRRRGSLDTSLLEYLEKEQPSHLAIRPGDFPDLARRADLFTPVVTCADTDRKTGGVTTLVLYETPWAPPSIRGLTGH